MQSSLTVITPAQSESLVSLYEAKLALNLQDSNTETLNDQLEMLIEWSSSEIAAMCNRVFAQETVTEKFTQVDTYHNRIYLSRYPVKTISAIAEDGEALVQGTDFDLDSASGLITRTDSAWYMPLTVTYTGGYDLPNAAPRALRQAALLMTREAYNAISRGDASIRMVSHKDSRVIYFDPNAKSGATASSGSPARRAVGDLLKHFTRFWV
jgi:hypothetical protein